MNSHTTKRFRKAYSQLPKQARQKARKAYKLWLIEPFHPTLQFKQVHPTKPVYSVRIDLDWRALSRRKGEDVIWFWIGSHDEYDMLIANL
jgi:hypothetical protein